MSQATVSMIFFICGGVALLLVVLSFFFQKIFPFSKYSIRTHIIQILACLMCGFCITYALELLFGEKPKALASTIFVVSILGLCISLFIYVSHKELTTIASFWITILSFAGFSFVEGNAAIFFGIKNSDVILYGFLVICASATFLYMARLPVIPKEKLVNAILYVGGLGFVTIFVGFTLLLLR